MAERSKSRLEQITISENSELINRKIVNAGFPSSIYIIAIKRKGVYLTAAGNTLLLAGDELYILTENEIGKMI